MEEFQKLQVNRAGGKPLHLCANCGEAHHSCHVIPIRERTDASAILGPAISVDFNLREPPAFGGIEQSPSRRQTYLL